MDEDFPLCAPSQYPISFSRAVWLILDCAHQTNTSRLCAFREQEDARLPPPNPKLAYSCSKRLAYLGSHCARPMRAFSGRALREHRRLSLLLILIHISRGVARLSFTARIEGPPLHRGASASKKDCLATPLSRLALLPLRLQAIRDN
jgi:hypothetical protein